jgi:hypothetical protein
VPPCRAGSNTAARRKRDDPFEFERIVIRHFREIQSYGVILATSTRSVDAGKTDAARPAVDRGSDQTAFDLR